MIKTQKTLHELTKLVARRPRIGPFRITRDATHGWSIALIGRHRGSIDLKLKAGEIATELSERYDLAPSIIPDPLPDTEQ